MYFFLLTSSQEKQSSFCLFPLLFLLNFFTVPSIMNGRSSFLKVCSFPRTIFPCPMINTGSDLVHPSSPMRQNGKFLFLITGYAQYFPTRSTGSQPARMEAIPIHWSLDDWLLEGCSIMFVWFGLNDDDGKHLGMKVLCLFHATLFFLFAYSNL